MRVSGRSLRDPVRIRSDIDRLSNGPRPYQNAKDRLTAAGQYAVPIYLEYLQNNAKKDLHPFIIRVMGEIGRPLLSAADRRTAGGGPDAADRADQRDRSDRVSAGVAGVAVVAVGSPGVAADQGGGGNGDRADRSDGACGEDVADGAVSGGGRELLREAGVVRADECRRRRRIRCGISTRI